MNARLLGGVVAALTALTAASSATAQYWRDRGPVMLNPNFMNMLAVPDVGCEVYIGMHIVLKNEGAVPVAAGTTIAWSLATGAHGSYVLWATLGPGGAVLVEDALSWPVVPTTQCQASIQ